MTSDEALVLMNEIQAAFEGRDIDKTLEYYHPDISYIGPAYPQPLEGIDSLRAAFTEYFRTPQRIRVAFEDIAVQELSTDIFIIHCRLRGTQSVLYREGRFHGMLSRVFVDDLVKPRIIHEHISLSE